MCDTFSIKKGGKGREQEIDITVITMEQMFMCLKTKKNLIFYVLCRKHTKNIHKNEKVSILKTLDSCIEEDKNYHHSC